MRTRRTLVLLALAAAIAACSDQAPVLSPVGAPPSQLISDGGTGGNPHFHFLPPIGAARVYSGTFDAGVSPVVSICRWTGAGCAQPVVATFTMSGSGSDAIRRDDAEEHYIVNWHTGRYGVDPSATYRIRVLLDGAELGYADVSLARQRTLPIKFRIETGARAGGGGILALSFLRNNVQELVRIDPASGAIATIATLSEVKWISGNSAYDAVNKRYYFTGSADPDINNTEAWRLYGVDAATGAILSRTDIREMTIYPGNFQFDDATGTILASTWWRNQVEELIRIDPRTGAITHVATIPEIEWVDNESTYDPVSRIFYLSGGKRDVVDSIPTDTGWAYVRGPGEWWLWGIDVVSGQVVSKVDIAQQSAFKGSMRFDPTTGSILALTWFRNRVEELVRINPRTGEITLVATIPEVLFIDSQAAWDPVNRRYYFNGGLDFTGNPGTWNLYGVDVATGAVVSRVDIHQQRIWAQNYHWAAP